MTRRQSGGKIEAGVSTGKSRFALGRLINLGREVALSRGVHLCRDSHPRTAGRARYGNSGAWQVHSFDMDSKDAPGRGMLIGFKHLLTDLSAK